MQVHFRQGQVVIRLLDGRVQEAMLKVVDRFGRFGILVGQFPDDPSSMAQKNLRLPSGSALWIERT